MEFLTTYGWAILILVVVMVALLSTNIFSPKVQNKCDSSLPIFCTDVKLKTNNEITLVLSTTGTSIKYSPGDLRTKVTKINLISPLSSECIPSPNIVEIEQKNEITCNEWNPSLNLVKGNRFNGEANVEYTLLESENANLKHNTKIKFSGTVE